MSRAIRAGDVISILAIVLGIVYLTGAYGFTAAWWYEARNVFVSDSFVGEEVVMDVDREIKRPFTGSYSVTMRSVPGHTVECEARGNIEYKPTAKLPDPVTLSWWAYSDERCYQPDPGAHVITTCWTIEQPFGVFPDKTTCIDSNVFRVTDPAEQQAIIEELRENTSDALKIQAEKYETKIEELQEELDTLGREAIRIPPVTGE